MFFQHFCYDVGDVGCLSGCQAVFKISNVGFKCVDVFVDVIQSSLDDHGHFVTGHGLFAFILAIRITFYDTGCN